MSYWPTGYPITAARAMARSKTSTRRWAGPHRGGARLQFLLTPTEDLTARLIVNYDASDERGNLSPYILDPATFANGTPRPITYSSRLARGYFGGYVPLIGPITSQYVDLNSA